MTTKSESRTPITLRVDIDEKAINQLVEEGRISEFVDAFPALVAGSLKAQLIDKAVGNLGGFHFHAGYVIERGGFRKVIYPVPRSEPAPSPAEQRPFGEPAPSPAAEPAPSPAKPAPPFARS